MAHTPDFSRSRFGTLVSLLARQWRRAVDLRLRPYGLTEATWLPLLRLARAPEPMRQKDLAASLGVDNSAVVRVLDALEAAGLIERRADEGDRRARAIVLTEPGRLTVAKVEAVAREVREEAFQGLGDGEIETAFRVLNHLSVAMAAASDRQGDS